MTSSPVYGTRESDFTRWNGDARSSLIQGGILTSRRAGFNALLEYRRRHWQDAFVELFI